MDVKTAGRTLELFELFAREQAPLRMSEIAREMAMPLSSCHNLIRALESRGYIYAVGDQKKLYPTRKIWGVAEQIAEAEPGIAILEPQIAKLRDDTGETAILGKRYGDEVVYLMVSISHAAIRFNASPGDVRPIYATGVGKALLSAMPAQTLDALLKRLPFTQFSDHTILDKDAIRRDIALSRERGYAVSQGEYVQDAVSIAVPMSIGSVDYAIALSGPSSRMNTSINAFGKLLRERALVIGEAAAQRSG